VSDAFVVDASVGFSWIYPSQASTETDKLLEEVAAGATVVVPALWFLEVANGLLAAQRRKLLTPAERKAALDRLLTLAFTVDDETARGICRRASDLAEKHGLSVYDAAYVEAALRRRLPLATRDRAVKDAAIRCGVSVRG
jgi:predicted nucleic acid-binding protein